MILGQIAQIIAFGVFSVIAIGGALGMATTMSMFRSGIFLMASFIGVAGLFILLSADLLSLLQVMMYIGGMLVMILFMVLFSHDPGGEMMASMEMSPIEKFFSLGLGSGQGEDEHSDATEPQGEQEGGDMHDGMDMSNMSHDGMHHSNGHDHMDMGNEDEDSDMQHSEGHDGMQGDMDMGDMDMSMVTPIRPLATVIAALVGALLVSLLLLRPNAWAVSGAAPDPRSAMMVGSLLMGKYMMAFEGAGLLILTGIFGAVMISRPGQHPSEKSREARVEMDAPPAPIADDPIRVN
jgi:NADH-quinone oxidoreductase subunit J